MDPSLPFLAELQKDDRLSESEQASQLEKHLQLNGIILDWVDGREGVDTVLDAVQELEGDVDKWLYKVANNIDTIYEMDGRVYGQEAGGIIVPFNYQRGL